jgi:hypothetical protein
LKQKKAKGKASTKGSYAMRYIAMGAANQFATNYVKQKKKLGGKT